MNVLQMLRLRSSCVGWFGLPEHEAGHDLLGVVVLIYESSNAVKKIIIQLYELLFLIFDAPIQN
jgi:hypothetical protein